MVAFHGSHVVVTGGTGALGSAVVAALRAAGTKRFALIITAVELPGTLDGATTVRRLRAKQPWVKALFIDTVLRGPRWNNRDSDEFIAAPFHRRELLGCVFELLQRDALPGADLVRRSRLDQHPD